MANKLRSPRTAQLLGASAAVAAGCILLVLLDAPLRMPLMNAAALLIGLSLLAILGLLRRLELPASAADLVLVALALAIPATAMLGPQLDGVARWVVVAGITVQPAMIAIPAIAVSLAARPTSLRGSAAAIAAAGVAIQPDPAAAAMLLAATAAPLIGSRGPVGLAAASAAAAALAVSLVRTPVLPPVRFVEGVGSQALTAGPLPAAVFLAGAILVFVPALATRRDHQCAALAFAGAWLGALGASFAGPYPTPILGFGGSAIVGYLLGVGLLTLGYAAATRTAHAQPAAGPADDQGLRFA